MQSSDIGDRPLNDHYKSDIRYTFQFCYWALKPIGIYSLVYKEASKFERIASVVLILICCSIIQFVIVPFSYYILFYEEDVKTKIKHMGPLTFCLTSLFKYGYLGMKGSELNRCVQHVERDWKMLQSDDHRDIMIQHVTISRKVTTLCAALMYTGGLSYHTIMPLLSEVNKNVTIRPLTYPGYEAFLNVQESPTYEVVYFIHCVYVVVTGNISMAAYSLTAIFITHACGQIKIQTSRLESLKQKGDMFEADFQSRLAIVVKDHTEILRFAKNVEVALRGLFLVEVIVSTLLICLLEYYCTVEWATSNSTAISTYIIILSSFTFNIFIFCYVGELLFGQGNEMATASYEVEWYNVSGKKARDIVMLLAVSKYPPKLTAGRVLILSMNTFGAILKSSMVYLNMLKTVTEF